MEVITMLKMPAKWKPVFSEVYDANKGNLEGRELVLSVKSREWAFMLSWQDGRRNPCLHSFVSLWMGLFLVTCGMLMQLNNSQEWTLGAFIVLSRWEVGACQSFTHFLLLKPIRVLSGRVYAHSIVAMRKLRLKNLPKVTLIIKWRGWDRIQTFYLQSQTCMNNLYFLSFTSTLKILPNVQNLAL